MAERPHILIFNPDQFRGDALGHLGNRADPTPVIDELVVYPERMRETLEQQNGLIFSQRLMLALIRNGASRDEAYRDVQRRALEAFEEDEDFRTLVDQDEAITSQLSDEQIDRCFDLDDALRHMDDIFERVFGA